MKRTSCLVLLMPIIFNLLPLPAKSASEMNGYTMAQFGNFVEDWKLVTVRFRKDSGEMRFTYANMASWEVLSKNGTVYPDGAVFAKISILTKDDSAFPSSAVPSGARRIQFMVKDQKKHASTEGWGYALFDAQGETYPGDSKTATMACAACHRLVPDRGYVFSQPLGVSVFPQKNEATWQERIKFKDQSRKSLPQEILKLIPSQYKNIRTLEGEIVKYVFSGTLDEVRPLLTKESLRTSLPAALISQDKKLFSVVIPDVAERCSDGKKAMKGIHTVINKDVKLLEIEFCADVSH